MNIIPLNIIIDSSRSFVVNSSAGYVAPLSDPIRSTMFPASRPISVAAFSLPQLARPNFPTAAMQSKAIDKLWPILPPAVDRFPDPLPR